MLSETNINRQKSSCPDACPQQVEVNSRKIITVIATIEWFSSITRYFGHPEFWENGFKDVIIIIIIFIDSN